MLDSRSTNVLSDVDALIPANLEAAHIRGPQAKPSSESKFTRTTTRTGFLIAGRQQISSRLSTWPDVCKAKYFVSSLIFADPVVTSSVYIAVPAISISSLKALLDIFF